MCEQAWGTNPQALYDWMEVNLGAVDGAHQQQIPDGQLCSAGREKYVAFDEPGDWPVTALAPDADGLTTLTFYATAPHAAQYFRFYLTREGFDPSTDRLRWDDLDLVHDSGEVSYPEIAGAPHYEFRVALPERDEPAILYFVWQRSDSPEAFYGCSDIVSGGGVGENLPESSPMPVLEPETTADPASPAPGLSGLTVELNLTDDWGSGACGEGVVTNHADQDVVWEAHVELPGTVTTAWDSRMTSHTHHAHPESSPSEQTWRVVGESWNARLAAGASTTFGFCLDRSAILPADEFQDPMAPLVDPLDPTANPVTDPVADPLADPVLDPVADPVATPAEDETDIPANSTPPAPIEGAVLAAYFPEWGIYGRDYRIKDVPADELSHLIYAFANFTENGDVTLFDPWAAVEVLFTAEQSVSGIRDAEGLYPGQPAFDDATWGNFGQIAQLKERHPDLRVSIAIGGWTLSTHFSSVLANETGREHAAESVKAFLESYPIFDGVDFDWEYPGGGGLPENSASSQDGANYALFLSRVRSKLDELTQDTGRRYEISVASPAGYEKVESFNLAGLEPLVDFFNVMTYDFHGSWESTTGHQAAMQADPDGYDVTTAIGLYLDAGVPPSKLVLGVPLYTRAWSGAAEGQDGGYKEPAAGPAPGSFWDSPGMYDYKDLLVRLQAPNSSWTLFWDDNAQAAYVYDSAGSVFSSFETPGTVSLKSEWALARGLGGMMFWDLSNDSTGGQESLVSAAAKSWSGSQTFAQIVTGSSLQFDHVLGGNGRFDLIRDADPLVPDTGGSDTVISEIPVPEEGDSQDLADPSADTNAGDAENDSAAAALDQNPGGNPPESPTGSVEEPSNPEPSPSELGVEVGGSLWWEGFTAQLTVKNETDIARDSWSFRFRSSHEISGAPWGVEIASRDLGDGFYEYTVSGLGWAASIPARGTIEVGFNARQGNPIGNAGQLSAEQLFDGGLFLD